MCFLSFTYCLLSLSLFPSIATQVFQQHHAWWSRLLLQWWWLLVQPLPGCNFLDAWTWMGRCKDMTSVFYVSYAQTCVLTLEVKGACFVLNHMIHFIIYYFVVSINCLNYGIHEKLQGQKQLAIEPRAGFVLIGATFLSLNLSMWVRGADLCCVGIWNKNINLTVRIVRSHGFIFM